MSDGVRLIVGGLPVSSDRPLPISGSLAFSGATNPTVYNITMTLAGTEYSQALPAGTKKYTVKCRTAVAVNLCFTNNQSGATYITIPANADYFEDLINFTGTLYFQCAVPATVLEVIAWV
jgi:hypothetical protein